MAHGTYTSGAYGSYRVPRVGRAHHWTAKLLGASMWFFMMYRAKQDGAALLGWEHPWEHGHHHGDDDHKEQQAHH